MKQFKKYTPIILFFGIVLAAWMHEYLGVVGFIAALYYSVIYYENELED